jgi:hypothetical protein
MKVLSGMYFMTISGDFKSGVEFQRILPVLHEFLNASEETPYIYLEELEFIDSEGMRFLRQYEDTAKITWKKDSWCHKRYLDKFAGV